MCLAVPAVICAEFKFNFVNLFEAINWAVKTHVKSGPATFICIDMLKILVCACPVSVCVCVCELAKLVLALIEFVNILVIASEHCIALQPELAVGWLAKLLNCCLAAVSQFYAPSRSHSPPHCAWQKLIN